MGLQRGKLQKAMMTDVLVILINLPIFEVKLFRLECCYKIKFLQRKVVRRLTHYEKVTLLIVKFFKVWGHLAKVMLPDPTKEKLDLKLLNVCLLDMVIIVLHIDSLN